MQKDNYNKKLPPQLLVIRNVQMFDLFYRFLLRYNNFPTQKTCVNVLPQIRRYNYRPGRSGLSAVYFLKIHFTCNLYIYKCNIHAQSYRIFGPVNSLPNIRPNIRIRLIAYLAHDCKGLIVFADFILGQVLPSVYTVKKSSSTSTDYK